MNTDIIMTITKACQNPTIRENYQLTSVTINSHYRNTVPETGETEHTVTARVEFGGPIVSLVIKNPEDPDRAGWCGNGITWYTLPEYALVTGLGIEE